MSVLPDSAFDEVSVDFAHVDGQTLLLVVDGYSRFLFVEPVSSMSASVYDPTPMTVVSKKGSMITAEGKNRTVTRNLLFFKNVYQPAVSHGNDGSQNSGFRSLADKECIQELPPTLESSNVPGPNPSNPPNIPHVKADLPSSSNLVPVPGSQTQTSQPGDQPPLRGSTRKRIP